MDSTQWKRVRELFEAALDLEESQQDSFLQSSSEPPEVIEGALILLESSRKDASAFEPPTPKQGVEENGPSPSLNIERGSHIGQYTVISRIGSGGMADVFLASQERPSRRVALKVLRANLSERAIKRFQFEAEILAQLSHPSIAQVYEAGEALIDCRTVPYIAMELVESSESLVVHARRKSLDLDARLRLFIEVAEAVQYGHEHGVLHRDLKPSNLLVSSNGRPKVIDYGIARAENQMESDRTLTGEVFGTIGYLAPERLRGERGTDTRGEVYSLGVVLFELLTGQTPNPMKDRSLVDAVRAIETGESPRPSTIEPSIPEGLDWVALKALSIDRTRRYSSVAEFVDDLHRHLEGATVLAGEPSARYRLRSWLRRNRVLTGLVLLGLLGTVATIIGTNIGLRQAEREAGIARNQSERADQEALTAKRQAKVSDAALTILETTLKHTNATQGGVDARISVVLDALDAQVAGTFATEPRIASRMDSLLVTAYLGSRDISAARRVLERAEARGTSSSKHDFEFKIAHAFVLQIEGNLKGAESEFRSLIIQAEQTSDAGIRSKRLEAVRGLIGILLSQGRIPDAVSLAEEEKPKLTEDIRKLTRASFLRLRGDALRMSGKLDEAMESVQDSIALSRSDPSGNFDCITGLRSAGMLELQRGQTKEARLLLEESARMATKFLGEDHPETALTGIVLSDLYLRSGEHERALAEYNRIEALPAYRKLTLRNRILQQDARAYVLLNLQRVPEALKASERAVSMLDASFAPADRIRLTVTSMQGNLLIQQDRTKEGLAVLEALTALATEHHGAGSGPAISMEQEWTQGLLHTGEYEKGLTLAQGQIRALNGKVPPGQSQLWNARQFQIECLIELQRAEEALTALAEIRSLIDLEAAPSRKARIEALTDQATALGSASSPRND